MVKTVETTAEEMSILFDNRCSYFWVKNIGETDVYLSPYNGIVAGADDVTLCPAGEGVRVTSMGRRLYALGASTLEIHAQGDVTSPFM